MEYIDIENWKRKTHFKFFQSMDYPQFNICMDIDVTNFVKYTKKHGLPFYYAMIYAATTTANQIDNFKYRIRDGKVVLHDTIHPSFTDMDKDENDDLFKMVTVDLTDGMFEFANKAKETSENQQESFVLEKLMGRDDLVYITCIPWISFTHISHTISLNKNDAVPRISWGKYYKQGDKILLPFSVQVHHALTDGVHIGKYVDKLQAFLNALK